MNKTFTYAIVLCFLLGTTFTTIVQAQPKGMQMACPTYTFPCSENFEGYPDDATNDNGDPTDFVHECWIHMDQNAEYPAISNLQAFSGTHSLYFNSYTEENLEVMHIGGSYNMRDVTLHLSAYAPAMGNFIIIGVVSDASNLHTYVPIDTLTPQYSNHWERFSVDFSSYAGNGKYLAFHSIGNNEIYIDDIAVDYFPCELMLPTYETYERFSLGQNDCWTNIANNALPVIDYDPLDTTMTFNYNYTYRYDTTYTQTLGTQDFAYTGSVQTYAVTPGTYILEVWGAQGGNAQNATYSGGYGGNGGYATGNLTVTQNMTLYIIVGGQGQSYNTSYGIKYGGAGGFGAGGSGGQPWMSNSVSGGAGGGGLSGIFTSSYYNGNELIIAGGGGGGGGSASSSSTNHYHGSNGGAGGGTNGEDGIYTMCQNFSISHKTASYRGMGGTQYQGGQQTSQNAQPGGKLYGGGGGGYSSGYNGNASTMAGGAAPTSSNSSSSAGGSGGGGGGYYGGSGGGEYGQGGGGGSGYVSGVLYSAYTTTGNQSFPSTTGSIETGHSGNGYVRISSDVPAILIDTILDHVSVDTFIHYNTHSLLIAPGVYPSYVISPQIEASDFHITGISFQVYSPVEETIEVGVVSDPNDLSTFSSFDNTITQAGMWKYVYAHHIPADMTGKHLAFKASGARKVHIDNLDFNVSVAIKDQQQPAYSIQLIPNPAHDYLTLKCSDENKTFEKVEIYNMYGKLVKSYPTTSNTFSVADLANGVYILRADNAVAKFVKN